MRILLFTGKGGVGKTTLAAATALYAAEKGYRTVVISTDVAHSLADVLQMRLDSQVQQVGASQLYAAEIDAADSLERYWADVQRHLAAALRSEGVEAAIASELAIIPGLDEILSLVQIKTLYDQGLYDTLIIDSAPTGGAMRLLSAPDLSRWYTKSPSFTKSLARVLWPSLKGLLKVPIGEGLVQERLSWLFEQIAALRQLLTDGDITSIRFVLNPDTMSVRETQRAFTYMNLFGFSVDAMFVNRVLPAQVTDPYFEGWRSSQAAQLERVREAFAPLPIYEIPLMRGEVLGTAALAELGRALYGEDDAVQRLARESPLKFEVEGERHILALRVSGVTGQQASLEKDGDELSIRLGSLRRTVTLPNYLATMQPAWAEINDGWLRIAFEEPSPQTSDRGSQSKR